MAATAYSPRSLEVRRPVPGLSVLTHMSAGLLALPVVTDVAYLQTTILMWKDFSSWLLFFGLIVAGVASVLWLIGLVTRRPGPTWGSVGLYVLVMAAAFFNSLLHAGDGWTAILPWGVTLSAVTCVLMFLAALLNRRAAAPLTLRTA
ncbi:DUF2231 domain-containing protein [Paracoccus sp. Ld10]|uniref:DUF2231 domain-containing protein n=1 Tax=Paracoccus sp. Ld10 TaxID=649158 RepID=UPI0038672D25